MKSHEARLAQVNKKPFLQVFAGEALMPPPIWIMRQAGRYLPEYRKVRAEAGSFLDLCLNPDLASEVTLQPIRRFGLDAAIIFSDILIVPHALGQELWFEDGVGPRLDALNDAGDLASLNTDGVLERLAPVFEALGRVRRGLDDKTALIGFAGAPWTVASYMIEGGSSKDFTKAKTWAYRDPGGFAALLELLVEVTADYLSAQIDAGAEAVQLFDSWSGVWPVSEHRRWCLEPSGKIAARVKKRHPQVPFIHFPRGAGLAYGDYAAVSEIDALALDTTVSLRWAKEVLAPKKVLQGNLDPLLLLSDQDKVKSATEEILRALAGRRHIFNLGHGITPETDPEMLAFLVKTVREFRP